MGDFNVTVCAHCLTTIRPCEHCVRKGYQCIDRICQTCTKQGVDGECPHRGDLEKSDGDGTQIYIFERYS